MEADPDRLQEWVGRTETRDDRIAPERAQAMQATLDQTDPLLAPGDALPPLWHWLYFWTVVPRSGLGRDGHPALGGFLPPVGVARRMWAGSRVKFLAPLRVGDMATRVSTIRSIAAKEGRTGRLVFVTVEHTVAGAEGPAIVDQQDIVYREDTGSGASGRPGNPAPKDATYNETVTPDPTMLFRYSALTFNGHRIHYDRPYAIDVEGYSGLVVHGPLLATLMVGLSVRAWPERRLSAFEFRGQRPVIDTAPFTVNGKPDGDETLELWAADSDGTLCMTGRAAFEADARS